MDSANKGNYVKMGIVIIVAIISLFIVSSFFTKKNSSNNGNNEDTNTVENNTITFSEPYLEFFDTTILLNLDTDSLNFHYPYVIVIDQSKLRTRVYNIDKKNLEIEKDGFLLDYTSYATLKKDNNIAYYNDVKVNINISQAFITEKDKFLYTSTDKPNEIYEYNVQKSESKLMYSTQKLITDFMFNDFQKVLFVGEVDTNTNKFYLTVGDKTVESPNLISLFFIYSNKENKTYNYFASFKSNLNNQNEAYYSIHQNDKIEITLENEGKIIFYK